MRRSRNAPMCNTSAAMLVLSSLIQRCSTPGRLPGSLCVRSNYGDVAATLPPGTRNRCISGDTPTIAEFMRSMCALLLSRGSFGSSVDTLSPRFALQHVQQAAVLFRAQKCMTAVPERRSGKPTVKLTRSHTPKFARRMRARRHKSYPKQCSQGIRPARRRFKVRQYLQEFV